MAAVRLINLASFLVALALVALCCANAASITRRAATAQTESTTTTTTTTQTSSSSVDGRQSSGGIGSNIPPEIEDAMLELREQAARLSRMRDSLANSREQQNRATAQTTTQTSSSSVDGRQSGGIRSNIPSEIELREIIDRFIIVGEQQDIVAPTQTATTAAAAAATTTTTTTTATVTENSTTEASTEESRRIGADALNYVVDETEFEELLRRLALEAENSIAADRANYVADDANIESLIRSLEQNTSSSNTSTSTSLPTIGNNKELPSSSSQDGQAEEECPICYEPLEGPNQSTFITNCAHKFHTKCMQGWINSLSHPRDAKCPMCRWSLEDEVSQIGEILCSFCGRATHNYDATQPPCGHTIHLGCLRAMRIERQVRGGGNVLCPTCMHPLPDVRSL